MVVNNPNNWHWVDKNCVAWSKEYFNDKLVGLGAEDGDKSVEINSVSSVEGDCEVTQRKGRVISLFDLKIVLQFKGSVGSGNSDETAVTGSITVPELAYDTEADDIQFAISLYNEDAKRDEIRPLIKQKLVPQLREILGRFGAVLIETHSSDIQLEIDQVNSALAKQNQEKRNAEKKAKDDRSKAADVPVSAAVSKKATAVEKSGSSVPKYNTSTLHIESSFNTTAEQIYITLLDPQRIAAWSRSPPVIEPAPAQEGSHFKLFGGSISGKIKKLVPNERIVQDWRLEDWKDGHFAHLDVSLNQGSSETKMVVSFSGVPIGEEDRVRGNFEDYYIKSIKITFGFGAVL